MVAERLDVDALASDDLPATVNVPFDVRDVVNTPSVARRSAVKNDAVEVALVNDADTAERRLAKRLEDVALVDELFVAMRLEIVVVASVEVPVTDNVPVA